MGYILAKYLLLLLGSWSHLLVKGAVRNLETGHGGDTDVEDGHQDDKGDQAHKDTYVDNLISVLILSSTLSTYRSGTTAPTICTQKKHDEWRLLDR